MGCEENEAKLLIYPLFKLLGVVKFGSNLISTEYPSFQRVDSLNRGSVIVQGEQLIKRIALTRKADS